MYLHMSLILSQGLFFENIGLLFGVEYISGINHTHIALFIWSNFSHFIVRRITFEVN